MDVSTTFLHGEFTEEVYMKQPEGFVEQGKEHLICRLNRSIYGLKQSPCCWNQALDSRLKELGFKQTAGDSCLYTCINSGGEISTSGYVFIQGGAAISWKSSKQTCVASSTAEAEYIALSAAVQEAVWLQQLMSDLLNKSIHETTILEDNQSTICLAKNQHTHG